MQAVIYAFKSPGSGAVYVGKHEPDVDPTLWPRRGNGYLPDGYKGSGDVVPRFHRCHGAAVEWRILAIVAVADWPRAERRAIHLARLIFGRMCVNVLSGGDGLTSADAYARWADPEMRRRMCDGIARSFDDPATRAAHQAHLSRMNSDPEEIIRKRAQMQGFHSDAEWNGRRLSRMRAFSSDPAEKAERLAKAALAVADPAVQAKRLATRHRNWVRRVNAKNRARRAAGQQGIGRDGTTQPPV